jgi:NAD(P)-dependent dehydrogenase (short-subunit alcohol dehydrogenase family)
LRKHNVAPDRGDVVVTGASGGVGSIAVALLAKLGYQVAAVTGKASAHDYLKKLGASQVLDRQAVDDAKREAAAFRPLGRRRGHRRRQHPRHPDPRHPAGRLRRRLRTGRRERPCR